MRPGWIAPVRPAGALPCPGCAAPAAARHSETKRGRCAQHVGARELACSELRFPAFPAAPLAPQTHQDLEVSESPPHPTPGLALCGPVKVGCKDQGDPHRHPHPGTLHPPKPRLWSPAASGPLYVQKWGAVEFQLKVYQLPHRPSRTYPTQSTTRPRPSFSKSTGRGPER